MFQRLQSEYRYRGKRVNLRVDLLRHHDREVLWEVVEFRNAVTVVPVLADDQVVFVHQFRPAVGKRILELPAGTLEPGEDPREAARRELEEETGYRAGTLRKLTEFFTVPGLGTERMFLFEARNLEPGPMRLEPHEDLHLVILSREEILQGIRSGRLEDAKTLVGLMFYLMPELRPGDR